MRRTKALLWAVATAAALGGNSVLGSTTTIKAPTECESGSYLDISGLECAACGANEEVTSDGLSCQCMLGTIRIVSPPSVQPTSLAESAGGDGFTECSSCLELQKVPSADGSVCMACDNSTGATLDTAAAECTCPGAGYALVERDATGIRLPNGKQCVQCPASSYRDPQDASRCKECPRVPSLIDTFMEYDAEVEQCVCPSDLPTGVQCTAPSVRVQRLETRYNVNLQQVNEVVYYNPGNGRDSQAFDSALMADSLPDAAWACSETADRQACNMVANLCVLNHYDPDSAACRLYTAITEERQLLKQYHREELNPEVDWTYSMPWLYYNDNPEEILLRTDLAAKMSFQKQSFGASTVSDLVFVVSVYALNGTWLGFHNLTTGFQPCGGRIDEIEGWFRFGTNYENGCRLSMRDLQRTVEAAGLQGRGMFYDLYLQDLAGDFTRTFPDRLYPVPVMNEALRQRGVAVNAPENQAVNSEQILVRRFFFLDTVTSVEVGGGDTVQGFRLATKFDLRIQLQPGSEGQIYPPKLVLQYTDQAISSLNPDPAVSYLFKVHYSIDLSNYEATFTTLTVVSLVLAGVLWLYRMYVFFRRRRNSNLDWEAMMYAAFQACGAVALWLFLQCTGIALYWLAFYKGQDAVFNMVPDNTQVQSFKELALVACVCQSIYTAFIVTRQCQYDIFLVDWEKPRSDFVLGGSSKLTRPISTWRTLFVCNEWNELQTVRLTNPGFTLIMLLLLLYGCQLESLGAFTPNSEQLDPSPYTPQSVLLRFALASTFYLAIGAAQVLFKYLFYHRYMEHPLEQFVDLLTLTNVSIILLEDTYAGYYLHGKSLMTHADTSLVELNIQMRKETEMQVDARGFITTGERRELKENQCFEMYITEELRREYDDILMKKLAKSRRMQSDTSLPWNMAMKPELAPEETVRAQSEIAEVFKRFLKEVESKAATHVREKVGTENWLMIPPDMMVAEHAVFFHDFKNQFAKYTFYGIEFDLLIFNILVFAIVDLETTNFAVAAFVAYLVNYVLTYYRAQAGENNLAEKSLVDSRFLI